jgi:hypothetical protein
MTRDKISFLTELARTVPGKTYLSEKTKSLSSVDVLCLECLTAWFAAPGAFPGENRQLP